MSSSRDYETERGALRVPLGTSDPDPAPLPKFEKFALLGNFRTTSSLVFDSSANFNAVKRAVKMYCEDTVDTETLECNCQLMPTVEKLANKYKCLIDDRSNSVPSESHQWPSPGCGVSDFSATIAAAVESGKIGNATTSVGHDPPKPIVGDECGLVSGSIETAPSANGLTSSSIGNAGADALISQRSADSAFRQLLRIPSRTCPVHTRREQKTSYVLPVINETTCNTINWRGVRATSALGSAGSVASGANTSSSTVVKGDSRNNATSGSRLREMRFTMPLMSAVFVVGVVLLFSCIFVLLYTKNRPKRKSRFWGNKWCTF